jgi:hypothetical protein
MPDGQEPIFLGYTWSHGMGHLARALLLCISWSPTGTKNDGDCDALSMVVGITAPR